MNVKVTHKSICIELGMVLCCLFDAVIGQQRAGCPIPKGENSQFIDKKLMLFLLICILISMNL